MKIGRIVSALLLVVLLATPTFASKTEAYGAKLTLTEVTNISEILATPEQYIDKKALRRMDPNEQYTIVASQMAFDDAGEFQG